MNEQWIRDTHAVKYYNEEFEGIPTNPPGEYMTATDVQLESVEIANWLDKNGGYGFRPRLRDKLQMARQIAAADDEDLEYDCD